MENYYSSYGLVNIGINTERNRISLFDVDNLRLSTAEAEIIMQEYIDEFPQDGKFGKNEVGVCEDWDDGMYSAEIL